jgi:hypothetical protein
MATTETREVATPEVPASTPSVAATTVLPKGGMRRNKEHSQS